MIGIQIVNRIQSLHKEGFLHRDIKPDNFLIGCGDKDDKDGALLFFFSSFFLIFNFISPNVCH